MGLSESPRTLAKVQMVCTLKVHVLFSTISPGHADKLILQIPHLQEITAHVKGNQPRIFSLICTAELRDLSGPLFGFRPCPTDYFCSFSQVNLSHCRKSHGAACGVDNGQLWGYRLIPRQRKPKPRLLVMPKTTEPIGTPAAPIQDFRTGFRGALVATWRQSLSGRSG